MTYWECSAVLRRVLPFAILVSAALHGATANALRVPSPAASTIALAMTKARRGDTVWLDNGIYPERVHVEPGIVLAARNPWGAVLRGEGKGTIVTLRGMAGIIGLEISNGTVGVLSKGNGNSITRCRIVQNWGTGIVCVGHMPRVEDNIIAFNRGSGLQGWRIRATVYSGVEHNTIAFNSNHGIALGGTSDIAVNNNIIAYNEQYGLKVSSEPRVALRGNTFFANSAEAIIPAPQGNYGFDPGFLAPREMNFTLAQNSPCRERGSDGTDIGARTLFVPSPR